MSLNFFPPPAEPLSLYRGQVMHMRLKPRTHRFTYNVFTILIDLNRLNDVNHVSRLFRVNRSAIMSFWEKDHGARDGAPLLIYVETILEEAGCIIPSPKVRMLCYPRIFGYVFNPLSVYYVYDDSDHLKALIYEVRNTFGEIHTYVAPLSAGELSEAGVRQVRDKLFYVSPFMDMAMRYHFRLRPPTHNVSVRILETDSEGPILSASFIGTHTPFHTQSALKALLALPFMPIKVLAGIHFEALRLWLKGMRLRPRPKPPAPISYNKV
jgi:DUF1365 family protein